MKDLEFRFKTRKFNNLIITEVKIYEDLSEPRLKGYAIKSPKDQHWKAKGQKAAVQNALDDCGFASAIGNEFKEKVWISFFNHSTATKRLRRVTNEKQTKS